MKKLFKKIVDYIDDKRTDLEIYHENLYCVLKVVFWIVAIVGALFLVPLALRSIGLTLKAIGILIAWGYDATTELIIENPNPFFFF